jgi:hypothetical protein
MAALDRTLESGRRVKRTKLNAQAQISVEAGLERTYNWIADELHQSRRG